MTALVVQQTMASTPIAQARTVSQPTTRAGKPLARRPEVRVWTRKFHVGPIGALATAPGLCRGFAALTTEAWGLDVISDVARVIVSELVTNIVQQVSVQDSRGDWVPRYDQNGNLPVFEVGMFSDGDVLLLEAYDRLPGVPDPQTSDLDDESGRGLAMVDTLADDWGFYPYGRGKVVWALQGPVAA